MAEYNYGGLANLSAKYGISQRTLKPIYDDVNSAVSQTTGDYASRKAIVIDYMADIPMDGLANHYDIPNHIGAVQQLARYDIPGVIGDQTVDVNDIIDEIIDETLPPPTDSKTEKLGWDSKKKNWVYTRPKMGKV